MSTDFGRDTYCLDSLRTGRMVSGPLLVGQRYYHRLITPRGALIGGEEEANFGEDIEDLIGEPGGKETEAKIRSKAQRAASFEECIRSVSVSISTSTDDAGDSTHEVTIVAETAEGPFRLVLAISSVTVSLIGLEAA